MKDLREHLFSLSGQRGKYPQCFLLKADGSYEFIGMWSQLEDMADLDSLPQVRFRSIFK